MQTTDDDGELELRDYLAVLRRRWWIIGCVTLLVVAAALAGSLAQTKVYATSAEVLLQPRTSEEIFAPDGQGGMVADLAVVQTEIEVMRSRSVRGAVIDRLGFEPDVDISAKGETRVVVVRAEHQEPERAAEIANTYARTYIETRRARLIDDLLAAGEQVQDKISDIDRQIAELDRPIRDLDTDVAEAESSSARQELQDRQDLLRQDAAAERAALQAQRAGYSSQLSQLELSGNLTQTGGAQLVSAAEEPTSPVRPTPLRNAVFALVVGLMLGAGLAFLRDYLDDSVRTKDDLARAMGGLPVLGLIPAVPGWKRTDPPRVVSTTAPKSPGAEAYRTLRTSIHFLGIDRQLKVIQVTSANAGEGKTTTIANLAVAMAGAGQRVVVVCCDLRRPRLHEFFGIENRIGFTSVLLGDAALPEAVHLAGEEVRVRLLSAGPIPPNPSELLASARTKELFQALANSADLVLVDSPPVLPVTDGLVLAGLVDATILVASSQVTSRKAAHRAVELLQQVGAPVVGAVLNNVRDNSDGYGYGYGADTYGPRPEKSPRRRGRRRARRASAAAAKDQARI